MHDRVGELQQVANEFESGSINTLLPPLYEGMPNYLALLDVILGKKSVDEVLPTQKR